MLEIKSDRRAWLVLAGAALAIIFSAFEVREPLIDFGWFNLTTSKLAAIVFFAVGIWWVAGQGMAGLREFAARRPLDLAVLAFLASNILSTAVAADKASAFKFSLRMVYSVGIYFGVSRLPRYLKSHLAVAGAMTATVLIVSAIGLVENFFLPASMRWLLDPFQEGITTFGAFYNVRISSTLPFPTTLSMYLELLMPIGLVFGLWLMDSEKRAARRRLLIAATVGGMTAIMMAQLYSYTRSAMVAAPASLLFGAAVAVWQRFGRRVWVMFVVGASLLFVILGASLLFSNKMDVRLGLSAQEQRYNAVYSLLSLPDGMKPGQQYTALVQVRNTGTLNWSNNDDQPVVMSYRWVSYPEGQEQDDVPFILTPLPQDVAPGQQTDVAVQLTTPDSPGSYVLDIEAVQVHVAWFSSTGVPGLQVPLDFSGGASQHFASSLPASRFDATTADETMASRSQLWKAALKFAGAHPLLGIGPDQFRFHYTDYIDVQPDNRLRTHDIFLEALANTGGVGLAVMLFLLASAFWVQIRLVRDHTRSQEVRLLSLGLLVALVAYVGHGLYDCFLWQTGVSYIFFALLGLTAWLDYNRKDLTKLTVVK